MSSNKPQIGDTLSKKALPATSTKRIVVLPWKVSKQSNASGETSASKKSKDSQIHGNQITCYIA
uniref:Uncharacterized protein n=1 Tax=Oryza punctata TaxID=4537 RepID=A0A0E0LL34_ORYPU